MENYSTMTISHKFVELIPDQLEDRIIYISTKYCTAIHKCCCGCQEEVVTPLSPTDWQLIFDGKHVSLYPSIGNWNFPCQSHYWITDNKVEWARKWTEEEIGVGKQQDYQNKREYYNKERLSGVVSKNDKSDSKNNLWLRLKKLWSLVCREHVKKSSR